MKESGRTSAASVLERRWAAVVRRDRTEEGRFVYGVTTTGVFCRPGCSSRTPKREHVQFYDTAEAAAAAGLRACKRCLPHGRDARAAEATVRKLCRYMETHLDDSLRLSDLAAWCGMSAGHLQRVFRKVVGVSPKEYVDGLRVQRLKQALREGDGTVTDAVFAAGYGSMSRVYERVDQELGMTPTEFRNGGRGVVVRYATAETALGLAMLSETERGLCFLQFGETAEELLGRLRAQYPQATLQAAAADGAGELLKWIAELRAYLDGESADVRLPVHVRATAFQRMVWRYLQQIPAGTTQSYREIAGALGRPTAARAVARACASNVVALAIPCHRVVRGTGELSGYRWGVERKRKLLEMEGRAARP